MAKLMRKENAIMEVEDNRVKEYESRGYEQVTENQLKEDAKKALKKTEAKAADKDK
ncbi:hypothetical protein K6L05_00205 [Salinicoccus roseus]|uniref:hypothetical protein n=1 Tax=Salinicoccus roseus TaxID=45670 RepID=UPI001CA6B125|nr:hypothetical protein [Salinicoccus roseus]MBY8908205.1 hypothetical protein [Salinicoccus roseus]